MKISPFAAAFALVLMFAAGFGIAHFVAASSKEQLVLPTEERRASNSDWRPLEIFLNPPYGSDKAIAELKARHSEGSLVGKRGEAAFEQLCLAKRMSVGSRFVEFSLHSAHGETHPTAHVVIDLKTGLIADVYFGALTW